MTLREKFRLPIEAMHNTSIIPTDFHSHLDFEIYYFYGGKCTMLLGDNIYDLEPGDLILMNGLTLHCPKVDYRYEYSRTVVHFSPTFAKQLLRPPYLNLDALKPFDQLKNIRIPLHSEDRGQLEPILERLCDLYTQQDHVAHDQFLSTFTQLLLLIHEITNKPYPLQTACASLKQGNVQQIISSIENNYMEDISLTDIARTVHLNKHYVVKLFKETTGITLFQYLYQRRINQAKVIFTMNPDKSVTEVAYQVGFKHGSHFSKAFKKYTGMTPELYRKRLR